MNTKTTIALLVVLFLIVGIFAYYKGVQKGVVKATGGAAKLVNGVVVPNASSSTDMMGNPTGWVPSASFACKDNSHFIAQFPNQNTLGVIVDGKLIRTLPHVSGDGQRYEDNTFVYVFAGEEATVINKTTKKTTTCEQPRDPNNAPMNFGDAAEGGAGFITTGGQNTTAPDVTLVVAESIVGKWQSMQDARFIREFTHTGKVSDYYDGKLVTSGEWYLFTSAKPLKVSFPLEKEAIYVQLTDVTDKSTTLNFKLTKISPETLELVYMERGTTNTFTRIK